MKGFDVTITKEEQKVIRSLERLIKKWPQSLSLFGWAGSFCVMKKGKDGRLCLIDADISNVCCDGGDPSDVEVNQFAEIEWK